MPLDITLQEDEPERIDDKREDDKQDCLHLTRQAENSLVQVGEKSNQQEEEPTSIEDNLHNPQPIHSRERKRKGRLRKFPPLGEGCGEEELRLSKGATRVDEFIAYYTEARNSLDDFLNTPLYRAIRDRLERLKKEWDTRDQDDEELIREVKQLADELREMRERKDSFRERVKAYLKQYLEDQPSLPREKILQLADEIFPATGRLSERLEKAFRAKLVVVLLRDAHGDWRGYEREIVELVRRAAEG